MSTNDTATTDIPALAAEAIAHEGPDAYFPGLDLDTDLAAEILASYLAAHPDEWTPATDESAWVCRSSDEDLVAWAELHQELEAKLIEAVTAIVSGGCDPDDLADQRAAINAAGIGIEAHLDGGAADDAYRGIQVDEGGRLTAWAYTSDEGDYCPLEVSAQVDEVVAREITDDQQLPEWLTIEQVTEAVAGARSAHAALTERYAEADPEVDETIADLPTDCTRFDGGIYYGQSGQGGIEVSVPLPNPGDEPRDQDDFRWVNYDGTSWSLS